ncbi:hypothetical protein KC341_g80 [Hortaea werneckii]|nr:hypothetical protein KC341_g80 [Hortaea werneckii]
MLEEPRVGTKYCVLDGLDECDEDSQRWLVAKLVELASVHGPESSNAAFKIAIISRPDVSGLNRCTQVRLDPDHDKQVGKDIQTFVFSRVQELTSRVSLPPELLREVHTTLLDRSEGTFLWVGFVMAGLLKKKTATEIHKALYSLPKGLPGIYGRMVLQIEEEHRHTSLLILRWVTLAFRPLSLAELAAAIGTHTPPHLTPIQAVRDQISMCGPLVKVEGNKTASLIHQSARDYLLRDKRDDDEVLEWFRIEPNESHTDLAVACVDCLVQSSSQYLKIQQQEPGTKLRDISLAKFQRQFPLRNYARFVDEESPVREVWRQRYRWRDLRLPRRFSALHTKLILGARRYGGRVSQRTQGSTAATARVSPTTSRAKGGVGLPHLSPFRPSLCIVEKTSLRCKPPGRSLTKHNRISNNRPLLQPYSFYRGNSTLELKLQIRYSLFRTLEMMPIPIQARIHLLPTIYFHTPYRYASLMNHVLYAQISLIHLRYPSVTTSRELRAPAHYRSRRKSSLPPK